MLRKQVEEMGQLNQGLLKEKEEFLRREQEGQKEKRGIFESNSKEIIALRQEIKGLKIVKQRKEVLEADLIEARRKNEERTQELEEEKFVHLPGMLDFKVPVLWKPSCDPAALLHGFDCNTTRVQELSHGWLGFSSLG